MPSFPNQAHLPRGLKQKQRHQTRYRLPALNWHALRPNQIAGTIFNELDDDSVLNEVRSDLLKAYFIALQYKFLLLTTGNIKC